jgi:glycosyltransferase involved in cell wall biosynthesis
VVLFIGRLDRQAIEQKGIKYLLKAVPLVAKKIDNVKFIIAGGGGNEQIGYLKKLTEELGVSSYVNFIAGFRHEEAPLIISMADVFVLPSLFESFGISLCEAMAMEKPVVSTRIRGVVDVVKDEETGLLVEPRNPGETAQAILKILYDKRLANRLGKNGRRHVKRNYDWNVISKKIEDLYINCSS